MTWSTISGASCTASERPLGQAISTVASSAFAGGIDALHRFRLVLPPANERYSLLI